MQGPTSPVAAEGCIAPFATPVYSRTCLRGDHRAPRRRRHVETETTGCVAGRPPSPEVAVAICGTGVQDSDDPRRARIVTGECSAPRDSAARPGGHPDDP